MWQALHCTSADLHLLQSGMAYRAKPVSSKCIKGSEINAQECLYIDVLVCEGFTVVCKPRLSWATSDMLQAAPHQELFYLTL